MPVFTLPHDKETVGASLGFPGCAVCCLTDIGMARAAADQLAPLGESNARAAERVAQKQARIESRKGKKKTKVQATSQQGTKK